MKRQAFTFWQAVALLAFVGVSAAILFPVFGRARYGERKHSCQSNLKQVGLGFMMYVQDYDEKFPLVSVGGSGWADTLQPYVKTRWIFRCPYPQDESSTISDYFYNARMAGRTQPAVARKNDISNIILIGDGVVGAGTNANITELPFEWVKEGATPARVKEGATPARRHFGGANYGFVDGQVKYFRPHAIAASRSTFDAKATFLVE